MSTAAKAALTAVGVIVLAVAAVSAIGWHQATQLAADQRELHADAQGSAEALRQERADLEGQLDALELRILELERQRDDVEQERDDAQREADDLRREITHLQAMVDDLLAELPDPELPHPEPAYLAPDPATVRVAARELLLGIGRRASDIDPAELDHLVQVYLGMHEQAWREGGDPDARFLTYFYEDRYAGEIATRESSQEAQRRGELWQDTMGDMRDQVREGGS